MNERALAIRQVTPETWTMIMRIAPVIHSARLFGTFSVEQAATIMLKGYELGLPLTASFEFIHVIQNKPSLSPRGALALILQSGLLEHFEVVDKPSVCTVEMRRRDGDTYATSFSMQDAQQAGLVKKDSGWEKYPANMLRWRAIGYCADVLFSDVTGGLKRADELGAEISEQGEVLPATWQPTSGQSDSITGVQSYNGPSQQDDSRATVTLTDLTDRYGVEAVLAVNNGMIPATDEQVAETAERLANG